MKNTIKKNAFVDKKAKVTGSTIGASSAVEGVVENSSIGKGCYIDRNSRIINSTIGDYAQVYNSELTCVHTGALFESEDAKILSARFGENNTVYGEVGNLSQAGDNNIFRKTSVLEGEQNVVGNNTIIDGRIINSFIGDGTKIHHPAAVIENSCIAPYGSHVVDIFNASVSNSVVWGGTDIGPGANIRPNSIIGPFVHIGTGGETKAAFIRGGSPLNKVEVAHRNYLGNSLAYVIQIDAAINSKAYYTELQKKMKALLYGTILKMDINQLVDDPIQPEEKLVIDYKGKKIAVTIEGINLGALFTTSNFDPRNDGFKGITIVKSGAKAGISSGVQAPAVIESKALIGSMSKTFGRQTGTGDIVAGDSTESVRKGAIIKQRGRLGNGTVDNVDINLDGLRQLEALVNVSSAGLKDATKQEKPVYAKELEILHAQIEELAEWTLRLLKLTEISVSNLKKDLKKPKLSSTDSKHIKKRLKEQNQVLAQSSTLTKEVEGIKSRVRTFTKKKVSDEACSPNDFKSFYRDFFKKQNRIHGTDGYRGNIYIEDKPVSYEDALKTALTADKRTPEVFELLAYSTIQALKLKGIDTENVLVGRDTRDLYAGIKGKEGRFTRAIIKGIRSAGANVLDMGITPIPNASYMLAYLDYKGSPTRTNVALIKTASHNPKHQDGLKVFYKAGRGKYIKLMPEDEESVTDIMFKTAINGSESCEQGKYLDNSAAAVQVFQQFMSGCLNGSGNLKGKFGIIDTIILDLSNGAVSVPPYKQAIDGLLRDCGIKNRHYVGARPNGININEDDPSKGKVGAGHFEGVDVITYKETRGGRWSSFPVLEKLFKCGMDKASELKKNGRLVVAVLTDGDGDRGYTMVYNPWENNVKLIDGDHALYLQLWNALENNGISNGETIAFSVESSTGFINGVTSLIKDYGFNVNLLESYDDRPSRDAINIVIAPVGDKYILFKQSLGSESTGHIIKKGVVLAGDSKTRNSVFAGNGILCAIETLASANDLYALHDGKPLELMNLVLYPYQHGNSQITYCYFVDKQLWKRGNDIWKQAEAIINDTLKKAFARKRNVAIESRVFERETDTLYTHVLSRDKSSGSVKQFTLTLHVRPSGTEDKVGIKIFGDNDKVIAKLSKELAEKMFSLFWKTMKNHASAYAIREAEILGLLKKPLTIGKLKKTLTGNATNKEVKRVAEIELAFLIDAMGLKKQGLIKTEGTGNNTVLTLTKRGKVFA